MTGRLRKRNASDNTKQSKTSKDVEKKLAEKPLPENASSPPKRRARGSPMKKVPKENQENNKKVSERPKRKRETKKDKEVDDDDGEDEDEEKVLPVQTKRRRLAGPKEDQQSNKKSPKRPARKQTSKVAKEIVEDDEKEGSVDNEVEDMDVDPPVEEQEKKMNSKKATQPARKQAAKKGKDIVEDESEDADDSKGEDEVSSVKQKGKKMTQKKVAQRPARKQTAKKEKEIVEEDEDEDEIPSVKQNGKKAATPERNGADKKKVIQRSTRRLAAKKMKEIFQNANKSDEDDEEEAPPAKGKGRKRITVPDVDNSDGDSGDEYKPDLDETVSSSDEAEAVESSEPESESDSDADSSPKKKKWTPSAAAKTSRASSKAKAAPKTACKSRAKKGARKNVSNLDINNGKGFQLEKAALVSGPLSGGIWPHLKLDFLQPDQIKDMNQNRPDHPDYDPSTLYIPQEFLDKLTPIMRQWWSFKVKHFDYVLCFKLGKWYDLYHMDSVIAANVLGLSFMRGEFAHSAFPESAYGRFAGLLIEKGYKVIRIEQTETPDMVLARCANSSTKVTRDDKLVTREICQISTRGTRIFNVLDTETPLINSNYLYSIVEKVNLKSKLPRYGICFIDTTIGTFHLTEFEDDHNYSRLLTLLSHYSPAHLIYERKYLSEETMKILNSHLPISTIKQSLQRDVQFWSSGKVLEHLKDGDYFKNESGDFSWPDGLKSYVNESDDSDLTPVPEKNLAINALGGCVYLLKDFILDEQLLGQRKFQTYIPPDINFVSSDGNKKVNNLPISMVIDAITLSNLDILGEKGSLISMLDQSCTPFGKRLLKQWICLPPCQKNVILDRQEAISELLQYPDVIQKVCGILNSLPDLERLLSKIHAHGNAAVAKNHPDARVIMFENMIYSKRKIDDFITILDSFTNVIQIVELLNIFECPLMKQIAHFEPDGGFPDLRDTLNHFKNGFNPDDALKEGCILPKKGFDDVYDNIMDEIAKIKSDSEAYLKEQCKYFDAKIIYVGSDDKSYQLEIPEYKTDKVNSDYELQGKKKGCYRYWTAETKEFLARKLKVEEEREDVIKDINRRMFAKFSDKYHLWASAVHKIAMIDILMSLTKYAKSGDMCVPEIADDSDDIKIVIKEGKHPCDTSKDFVPNDTSLAADDYNPLILLTGPNMGGKSTIMRQVGLLTLLAQIGSHVPAASFKWSLVDRIFTRLGANDDMMTHRSTFLVELSETATILQHATKHSLVLIDELGRGTSTFDGTAIAAAVLDTLAKLKCRTLFSTHYHSLINDFKDNDSVSMAHMACQVESEESEVSQETVKFLYKLVQGACPKSYGFNAARLAGIKQNITRKAHEVANEFERQYNCRQLFVSIFNSNKNTLKSTLEQLSTVTV